MKKTALLILTLLSAAFTVMGFAQADTTRLLVTPYGIDENYALFRSPSFISTYETDFEQTAFVGDGETLYGYRKGIAEAKGSLAANTVALHAGAAGLFGLNQNGDMTRYTVSANAVETRQVFSLDPEATGSTADITGFYDFAWLDESHLVALEKQRAIDSAEQIVWSLHSYLFQDDRFAHDTNLIIDTRASADVALTATNGVIYYTLPAGTGSTVNAVDGDSLTSDSVTTVFASAARIEALSAAGDFLYALTDTALTAYQTTGTLLATLTFTGETAFTAGKIGSADALSAAGNGVTVLDTRTLSVQSFTVENGEFVPDGLTLYGSSQARYSNPIQTAHANGVLYLLDAGNKRVLAGEEVYSYPTNAKLLGVTASGGMYLADETNLYRANDTDHTFPAVAFASFGAIKDLIPYRGESLLLLADDALFEIKGETVTKLQDAADVVAIAYNNKDGSLFLLYNTQLTRTKNLDTVQLPLPEGFRPTDVTTDFAGVAYLIGEGGFALVKGAEVTTFPSYENPLDFYGETKPSSLSFDPDSGDLYLCYPQAHAVGKIAKSAVDGTAAGDIPDWIESSGSLPDSFPEEIRIAEVDGYPSNLLYPYLRTGSVERMEAGTRVILLQKVQQEYWLVFANGNFGYLLEYGLTVFEPSAASYADCRTLTARTSLFALPSFAKEGSDYRFQTQSLGADLPLTPETVLGEIEGTNWLSVRYNNERLYLPVSAVYDAHETDYPIYEYVQANASPADTVSLYAQADENSEILAEIPDGERLAVLERADGWIKVLRQRETGRQIGWIKSSQIHETGLTALQKTGIILLVALIVIGIVTVIVRKKQK